MDLDILGEIDHKNPLFYIFMCAATLLPGILIVFLFGRSLFMQSGPFMVMLLGMAITVPIFLLNYVMALALKRPRTSKKAAMIDVHVITAALVTSTSFYLSLCLGWIFFSKLIVFSGAILAFEGMWIMLCVYTAHQLKEEEARKVRKKRAERPVKTIAAETL